jgi:hypothetical protein
MAKSGGFNPRYRSTISPFGTKPKGLFYYFSNHKKNNNQYLVKNDKTINNI